VCCARDAVLKAGDGLLKMVAIFHFLPDQFFQFAFSLAPALGLARTGVRLRATGTAAQLKFAGSLELQDGTAP
jgi:hypothetical protein